MDEHALIDAVTAEVPVGRLRALANRDDVASLSVDAVVSAGADNVGTLAGMLLPTLGIAGSADIGTDVGVAILDSGIVYHDQIPVAAFYDFLRGGAKVKQYDYGHGTHVAGAIRNKDDRSDALPERRPRLEAHRHEGPRRRWFRVRSNVISALEFAIANKQALKIDVINLSLGHPVYEAAATDPLVRAVERAVAAGIVVVVRGRKRGAEPLDRRNRYAGDLVAGQRAFGNHRRRGRHEQHAHACGRRSGAVQLSRPYLVRRVRKPDVVAPGRRVVSFMAK